MSRMLPRLFPLTLLAIALASCVPSEDSLPLTDNLGAADLSLGADEQAALDKVSAPDLIYPHWHQLFTAKDRLGDPDLTLLGRHLTDG